MSLVLTEFLSNSISYREFLKQSVIRDLRKRYKRSLLGYLWSMLNPLIMMLILAVVFSHIMRSNIKDYAVFLFAGMLPWTYFSSTISGSLGSIRQNISIINQVPVPKYLFCLSLAWSNLINLLLSVLPLILVMLILKRTIPLTVLALPLMLIPLFMFTLGISLVVSVLNVFFEDTQHLTALALQALYFLCPILYSESDLPGWLLPWIKLNPLFPLILQFRALFYEGSLPSIESYLLQLLSSLLILAFGLWVFKRSDNKFIYFI